jgi:hypothetical protein
LTFFLGRSQWPRGLRHELSSPVLTLRLRVLIRLEAYMSVRLFCVCVVLYIGSGLETGSSTLHGVLPAAYKLNSMSVFRKETIPPERPPLADEVNAKFCG